MKVLIAEDEPSMLKIIAAYFNKEGFQTFLATNGEEALAIFEAQKIDLAILDWMMPKVDGIEVCHYIKNNSDTKVLILTAKGQVCDELEALNIGADEYIKKPFDPRILLLRAKKLLKYDKRIVAGPIRVSLQEKKCYVNEELITLTKIEFDLLVTFMSNKGIILTRDQLIDLVWGFGYVGDYRTVDTHIRRLRTKVGDEMITTHRGLGYCMEVKPH